MKQPLFDGERFGVCSLADEEWAEMRDVVAPFYEAGGTERDNGDVLLQQLESVLTREATEEAHKIAHALYGTASTAGALRLAAAVKLYQQTLSAEGVVELRALMEESRLAFNAAKPGSA